MSAEVRAMRVQSIFNVGDYRCEMVWADGEAHCFWKPRVPPLRSLDVDAGRQYKAGRASFILAVQEQTGNRIHVVDVRIVE